MLFTIAPKKEDAFAARAVKAANGDGSMSGDAGVGALLDRNPGISFMMGLDIKAGIDWLKTFPEAARDLANIPAPVGSNLADVYVTSIYGKDGKSRARFAIGQQLIDQLRAMADKM